MIFTSTTNTIKIWIRKATNDLKTSNYFWVLKLPIWQKVWMIMMAGCEFNKPFKDSLWLILKGTYWKPDGAVGINKLPCQ